MTRILLLILIIFITISILPKSATPPPPPSKFLPTPSYFPPTFSPQTLPTGYTQLPLVIPIEVVDKDQYDQMFLHVEGLPPGLSVSDCTHHQSGTGTISTCNISGNPQTAGTFNLNLRATDKMGHTGTVTKQLVINHWYQRFPFSK